MFELDFAGEPEIGTTSKIVGKSNRVEDKWLDFEWNCEGKLYELLCKQNSGRL